ncbi:MAG: hypothetical protein ACKVTZ_13550 [Bacteroidia bacterium]
MLLDSYHETHHYKDGIADNKTYRFDEDGVHITELIVHNEQLNRVQYYETFYLSGRVEKHIDVVFVDNIPYLMEKVYTDEDKHEIILSRSYIDPYYTGKGEYVPNELKQVHKIKKKKCWFSKLQRE